MAIESIPVYDQVVVLCPWHKTGGTEALHQLASTINDLGGQAVIFYIDKGTEIITDVDQILVKNSPHPGDILYDYNVTRKDCVNITADSAIVIPEAYAQIAEIKIGATKILWWLSVDNAALGKSSHINEFFSRSDIIHLYQSEYAKHALSGQGVRTKFAVSDYVSVVAKPNQMSTKSRTISYYPTKGKELAVAFFKRYQDLNTVAIENMTRAQCDHELANSAIFIDFGHQPGKDRVPREAAMCGAVVLLRAKGSANYFLDHPLDQQYLFTDQDIYNGSLRRKVDDILNNYKHHHDQQSRYRRRIALEKEEFYLQIKTFFFENS